MKILFFSGSLRTNSLNKKLIQEAYRISQTLNVDGEVVDLRDYPAPLYDGDIEALGIPDAVINLGRKIRNADALVISTPEYNASISSPLKNIVDWLSRDKPTSLNNKHLLLLAVSPGPLKGVRGLWHTRQPFEALGVHVFPQMMGIQNTENTFDENHQLKEQKDIDNLHKLLGQYIDHIKR